MKTCYPTFSLVPIRLEDQAVLIQLMETIYKAAYRDFWVDGGDWYLELCYNSENLKKELGRATSHYFFVQIQGRNMGILKYDFPFSPKEMELPNAMKLHRLYLHEDLHGTGVAKELLLLLEAKAQDQNLESIWLEVMDKSTRAKQFYSKMGFAKCLEYQLEFEKLKVEYRSIEIWSKKIPNLPRP